MAAARVSPNRQGAATGFPQVPGLSQHQQAIAAHNARVQAHIANNRAHSRGGAHQGASVTRNNVIEPLAVVQHTVQHHAQQPSLTSHIVPSGAVAQAGFQQSHHAAPASVVSHQTASVGAVAHHSAPASVVAHHPAHATVVAHHAAPVAPVAVAHHANHGPAIHHEHHVAPAVAITHQAAPIAPAGPALHPHLQLPSVAANQGFGNDVAVDIASVAVAGERCIDKIVVVEETEEDETIECHHRYDDLTLHL